MPIKTINKQNVFILVLLFCTYLLAYYFCKVFGRDQSQFTDENFPYIFLGVQLLSSFFGAVVLLKCLFIKSRSIRIIGYFIVGYFVGIIVLTINLFWTELVYHPYVLYANDENYKILVEKYSRKEIIIKYLYRLYFTSFSVTYFFWFVCGFLGICLEILFKKDNV